MNASVNLNIAGFNEVGTNSVQDGIVVTGEARSFDNKELDVITAAIRREFESAAFEVKSSEGVRGEINFEVDQAYHAFELPADHSTVTRAMAAIRKAGLEPTTSVVRGGLDASWLNRHGVPTVCLGMGCRKPHTKEEYLLRREFESACEIALLLALGE
jgi:tripeptide aminopeptidase